MYVNQGVIQKIISKETYDIMKICKKIGNYDDTVIEIQEYILNLYGNITYYSDSELYNYLLEIVLDLSNENNIKKILKDGINDSFKKKMFANHFVYTPINYADLICMLITNISLMQFRTKVEGEYIDLFLIDYNNQVLSADDIDEANIYGVTSKIDEQNSAVIFKKTKKMNKNLTENE